MDKDPGVNEFRQILMLFLTVHLSIILVIDLLNAQMIVL